MSPGAGRHEKRQCDPCSVVCKMQNNPGQQTEEQVQSPESKGWENEFNDSCIGRLIRVSCMPCGNDKRLKNHGACNEVATPAELGDDQSSCCQRRRAEQALFPKARLSGL